MPYYTERGQYIRNPSAYAHTGAPMYKTKYSNVDINKPTSIYVAHLEKGKKYVGKTGNFEKRCDQHFTGSGSKVTKKFKPHEIEEVDIIPGFFSDDAEQSVTEDMINVCGYNNVRGGCYTNSKTFN